MNSEEANIIKRLKKGEQSAYELLFRTYYIPLCIYAQRYLERKDLAEDIVADTFLNIWRNRKKIEIKISLKAYLFQAVCKNSLNHLRKAKKELLMEDHTSTSTFAAEANHHNGNELPSDILFIKELGEKIRQGVLNLPPQQQTTFKLQRYEGKKNREIAEIMGLSVKTVEMHLAKAVVSLRKHLKDYMS
ncbi:MAG: RNA polymerase sigma-70 factor [Mariniphaga sp.]